MLARRTPHSVVAELDSIVSPTRTAHLPTSFTSMATATYPHPCQRSWAPGLPGLSRETRDSDRTNASRSRRLHSTTGRAWNQQATLCICSPEESSPAVCQNLKIIELAFFPKRLPAYTIVSLLAPSVPFSDSSGELLLGTDHLHTLT